MPDDAVAYESIILGAVATMVLSLTGFPACLIVAQISAISRLSPTVISPGKDASSSVSVRSWELVGAT